MARILITGAHGFIGKHLAKALASEGHQISGLGHGVWPTMEALEWGVQEWLNGDVHTANLRTLQMRGGPDFIFHLAGGSTVGAAIASPREDFFRTVASTVELLEWIRLDVPFARLIVVSSAAVYGAGVYGPIPEDGATTPFSPYGYHKRMMELLCQSYSDTYGLDFRIARLFSVYGPELKKQLLWDVCTRLNRRESPIVLGGTGQELRDWTYVSDVVAALECIAFGDFSKDDRTFNVGTGLGVTVQKIAQLLIDIWCEQSGLSDRPLLQFSGSSRPGDPFSLVANADRLSRMGFHFEISLVDGLNSFVGWFRRIAVS